MATNHTQNYQLNLWEPTDRFLRTEFNENSEKLDAALKAEADARSALAQTVAQKADASTVTALTQTVNGKADASVLAALTQTVAGIISDDLLFETALTESSNRIVIPLPAEVRAKYRKLVLYADLKTQETTSGYLYFNGSTQPYSVLISEGYFATSNYGSLYTAMQKYPEADSFSRVELYLTAPRVCSLAASAQSYQPAGADGSVRGTGSLTFHAARTLTWDQVTEMDISASLLAGSWVKLYGVR